MVDIRVTLFTTRKAWVKDTDLLNFIMHNYFLLLS
jgi:hypothetical protein